MFYSFRNVLVFVYKLICFKLVSDSFLRQFKTSEMIEFVDMEKMQVAENDSKIVSINEYSRYPIRNLEDSRAMKLKRYINE